ncbi:MAG: hypothetical protein II841_04765 [Bacteroidales bacterium]|nr:hypothetical protein [Bacteroidales bacterium]
MSNEIQNTTTATQKSFRKGLRELRVKDVAPVKAQLLEILGVTSKQSFIRYADGKVANLDVEKARKIETLFALYGVTECWGN